MSALAEKQTIGGVDLEFVETNSKEMGLLHGCTIKAWNGNSFKKAINKHRKSYSLPGIRSKELEIAVKDGKI